MQGDETNGSDGTLGRIALKQVRVSRAEAEARTREGSGAPRKANHPMNRLVPYLDLFWRLSDEELSRLARAPSSAVEALRQQINEINRALGRYADLLPRLSDEELARLTGASAKTIRFWRLSQPRHLQGRSSTESRREPSSAQSSASMVRSDEDSAEISGSQPLRLAAEQTGEHEPSPEDSGTFVIDTGA